MNNDNSNYSSKKIKNDIKYLDKSKQRIKFLLKKYLN